MSSSPSKLVYGDPNQGIARMVVKIINSASNLYAIGPIRVKNHNPNAPTSQEDEKISIRVDDPVKNHNHTLNELWVITIVRELSTFGEDTRVPDVIITIKNVGTGLYAWDPEDPPEHEPVYENAAAREWKMVATRDYHHKITPTGPQQDKLWWTDLQGEPGKPITLEYFRDPFEKRHWIIDQLPKAEAEEILKEAERRAKESQTPTHAA